MADKQAINIATHAFWKLRLRIYCIQSRTMECTLPKRTWIEHGKKGICIWLQKYIIIFFFEHCFFCINPSEKADLRKWEWIFFLCLLWGFANHLTRTKIHTNVLELYFVTKNCVKIHSNYFTRRSTSSVRAKNFSSVWERSFRKQSKNEN